MRKYLILIAIITLFCIITFQNYNMPTKKEIANFNLKITNSLTPIEIDNTNSTKNWSYTASHFNWCSGIGTWNDPYVIENIIIDAKGSGSCILIKNSDVYFKIINCRLLHSGYRWMDAGIKLSNVSNGILMNSTCSYENFGISIEDGNNITTKGNDLSWNREYGIYLVDSNNNTIVENTVNYNYWGGIFLENSKNNNLSKNIVCETSVIAILLEDSNNNTILENTVNYNDGGVFLTHSNNNSLVENIVNDNDAGISLSRSNNNSLLGNEVCRNEFRGISLYYSDNNSILGNKANYNEYGINLENSNYNIILGNMLIGNSKCIYESNCKGNLFENNNCGEEKIMIHGYVMTIIFSNLFILTLILKKKRIKKKMI